MAKINNLQLGISYWKKINLWLSINMFLLSDETFIFYFDDYVFYFHDVYCTSIKRKHDPKIDETLTQRKVTSWPYQTQI